MDCMNNKTSLLGIVDHNVKKFHRSLSFLTRNLTKLNKRIVLKLLDLWFVDIRYFSSLWKSSP